LQWQWSCSDRGRGGGSAVAYSDVLYGLAMISIHTRGYSRGQVDNWKEKEENNRTSTVLYGQRRCKNRKGEWRFAFALDKSQ